MTAAISLPSKKKKHPLTGRGLVARNCLAHYSSRMLLAQLLLLQLHPGRLLPMIEIQRRNARLELLLVLLLVVLRSRNKSITIDKLETRRPVGMQMGTSHRRRSKFIL